jgi:hypothetical protein
MPNKTGGPAFPDLQENWRGEKGMTLRDYFAAKAMQGMMVDVEQPSCDYIAKQAYAMADAMLEARNAAQ